MMRLRSRLVACTGSGRSQLQTGCKHDLAALRAGTPKPAVPSAEPGVGQEAKKGADLDAKSEASEVVMFDFTAPAGDPDATTVEPEAAEEPEAPASPPKPRQQHGAPRAGAFWLHDDRFEPGEARPAKQL